VHLQEAGKPGNKLEQASEKESQELPFENQEKYAEDEKIIRDHAEPVC